MAESLVNVTEGSGKKLHTFQRTIGANNVEDEVVILGNPYLAAYAASSSTLSAATAADHVMQIMAGASLNVYVTRIRVYQTVVATAAAMTNWMVLRLTTAGTGGTVNIISPLDGTDAVAGAAPMSLPTVKGTEGARLWNGYVGLIQTIPTGGVAPLILDLDFDRLKVKPIRIPAGTANGICLKHVTGAAGAQVMWDVELYEANF